MQRRDVFRVRTPVAQPVLCLVNTGGQEVALPLDDIGAGGVGLFDDAGTLDPTVGKVYRACRLELPEIGSVPVDLRVAQAREVTLPNGRVRQRLGFAYEGHNARAQQLIQRYVIQLEREAIARRRGLA
ncbi:MAG: Flagellar brake protein YcgR [Paracidovorax wautersii]|uniref:Flagellar brake protein YcgR n=1 Tax=Paracidovorax wautersii TaxID=1177982 RepID=A0A7V8FSG8_9BURK|nr:MAG: Flagellar brake protein YcgR [Paracidovorax wautersii]